MAAIGGQGSVAWQMRLARDPIAKRLPLTAEAKAALLAEVTASDEAKALVATGYFNDGSVAYLASRWLAKAEQAWLLDGQPTAGYPASAKAQMAQMAKEMR